MSYKLTPIVLLVMALYTVDARADEDADTPIFSFSGFGTLGVTHSSEDKADFTSNTYKPNGAGHSRRWSADVDSLLGAQVTANFTSQLSAVLQVISEENYDNTYRPHVEWANVKYQFTPDFSIRFGRAVLPAFLFSDYRKVGYAIPWVRPPREVYQLLPVSSNDGVDASYRMHFGEVTNTVRGNYGYKVTRAPHNGGFDKAHEAWGLSDTVEYGSLTLRINYQRANLTIDAVQPFFDAFKQFGPEGVAIADKYGANSMPQHLLSIGASYDPGKWFLIGEWGHNTVHSFIGESTAWYVSGGYRLGDFTPYLVYAQTKADSNTSDPGLTLSALPPPLAGPAAGLNAGLNAILESVPVQNTISVGARWDFMKNTALKLQFDHTNIGAGSPGLLSNTQPGFQPGGKVNLFSATIDFVF